MEDGPARNESEESRGGACEQWREWPKVKPKGSHQAPEESGAKEKDQEPLLADSFDEGSAEGPNKKKIECEPENDVENPHRRRCKWISEESPEEPIREGGPGESEVEVELESEQRKEGSAKNKHE